MSSTRPVVVDLTNVLSGILRIPYDPETSLFPLTIYTDKSKMVFDFCIYFSGDISKHDMIMKGNVIRIKHNRQLDCDFIYVKITSNVHCKLKMSYSYSTKMKKKSSAREDVFRKDKVEKIYDTYYQICDRVNERKEAETSRVNFPARNILTQTMKQDPTQIAVQRRMKNLLRAKKSQIARERNNDYYFEKVKTALIQTYSHDLKMCQEEALYTQNYQKHKKLAIQGYLIHFLVFYKVFKTLSNNLHKYKFMKLQQQVKTRKRADTAKKLRECLQKNLIGKNQRLVQYACNGLEVAGKMFQESAIERAKDAIVIYIFNHDLYSKMRLFDNSLNLVAKSKMFSTSHVDAKEDQRSFEEKKREYIKFRIYVAESHRGASKTKPEKHGSEGRHGKDHESSVLRVEKTLL